VITYVDTSSLLKLLIDEEGSEQVGLIWDTADRLASVSLVVVEARAALAAAARSRPLTSEQHRQAKADLTGLVNGLNLVEVTDTLIAEAAQLAEDEALRGYDAVHLAAALLVEASILTSADTDLCNAAQRRGLHIANPLDR
jgi:uncharacterized protein